MKVVCDREKFLASFQTASAVAPSRSPKPILQNVKFEATGSGEAIGTMMATDLEVGVRVNSPGIHVDAPGSAILPIGRFTSILRESSDAQIHLQTDGQGTIVRGDRSEFRLPAENPDEFPAVAEFNETKYHELPGRLLREIIRRTVFATDVESSRYALGGVLVELTADKIIAVGTDGRRLAMMEAPAKSVGGHETGNNTTIIPTRAMHFIERALADGEAEVQLATRANDVLVKTARATIYSRLVEGRFPKWRDVFPRRPDATKIELIVGPVYSAVRQAAIVTDEESRGVDFTFGDGKLVLAGRSARVGQSRVELPIPYDGSAITITLDPRYMNDFLKVLDPEKTFTLELKDAESAAVCHTDDGYGYVIMPLARER
ncbi:MAG TPA: DNA polymerase III subunit beta [Pirellulales bacterium]|nr:DNA polymerase III subunit beta [Pirellulales bacterium]